MKLFTILIVLSMVFIMSCSTAQDPPDAEYWIKKLDLTAHPEGGYFRETFRGAGSIKTENLPRDYSGPRNTYSVIYFLLKSGQISHLHRLKSDEIWDFYAGSPVTLYGIDTQGKAFEKKLGANPGNGESLQHRVPAGCWFGAAVDHPDSFTLVGCFVAPGFDFQDFEMADRGVLLEKHPQHREMIVRLTHD